MTRQEFAKKYQVDYNLVIAASKRIKETKRQKNVQFAEGDLGKAVCEELRYRIQRMEMNLAPVRCDYDKLRIICWNAAL